MPLRSPPPTRLSRFRCHRSRLGSGAARRGASRRRSRCASPTRTPAAPSRRSPPRPRRWGPRRRTSTPTRCTAPPRRSSACRRLCCRARRRWRGCLPTLWGARGRGRTGGTPRGAPPASRAQGSCEAAAPLFVVQKQLARRALASAVHELWLGSVGWLRGPSFFFWWRRRLDGSPRLLWKLCLRCAPSSRPCAFESAVSAQRCAAWMSASACFVRRVECLHEWRPRSCGSHCVWTLHLRLKHYLSRCFRGRGERESCVVLT
mmetsp:Transcript_4592/g.11573  ORF Transcript_4592/g.11573 Transcript_4592/m.11573 type:complete len:261 (+) Transcript_4592:368-1150(+)